MLKAVRAHVKMPPAVVARARESGVEPRAPVQFVDRFAVGEVHDQRRALIREFRTAAKPAGAVNSVSVQSAHPKRIVAQRKRVGVLCLGGMGGSAHVARVAAQGMAKAGHDVTLLTGGGAFWKDGEETLCKHADIDVPDAPKEPDAAWVQPLTQRIVAAVRSGKIEVLNVHYCAGLLQAAIDAQALLRRVGHKLSVVATLHGTDVTGFGQDPKHAADLRAQLLKCDAVSAVSHVLADQAQRAFSLDVQPTVILNSVDREAWNPACWSNVRERIAPNGEVILAHVSNLRAVKRPLDAVDALKTIRDGGVQAKLMILGDGPMLSDVHDYAEKLGIAEFIIPMGRIDQDKLPKYVAAADFNLVTSQNESFCLAALEASACGVPTVGTRCGGLEEVLGAVDSDGTPGGSSKLLADVGDGKRIGEICLELIKDPKRYARVQREVLNLAHQQFPRDLQVQGYLSLLD